MKFENIDVSKAIDRAKEVLNEDKKLSLAVKAVIELLLLIIGILVERVTKNSSNSSKPPSADQNREKKTNDKKDPKKKPGGQNGHNGSTLMPVENPDKIVDLKVNKKDLPKGEVFKEAGFEARQVIDIKITKVITEYRAHILKGKGGKRYMAQFPEGITQPIQYGNSVKTMAVYMSQYQLIPYNRAQDFFTNELKIAMSMGTLFNFNKDAYDKLEEFDEIAKEKLRKSTRVHADETGININKEKFWLHTACNDKWTHFYPHEKRGSEAMDAIGILPNFKGVLCHDHWKSYYKYTNCSHSLCNAHHIRELQGVIDNNKHAWAQEIQDFLCATNEEVQAAGGVLSEEAQAEKRKKYREILARGDIESPPPVRDPNNKKRGRLKKEKHRNLLERLRDYEDDVLRFMTSKDVPFTNNLGENDLRMTKVQQKISGCFRALEGAKIFCRVRGYLLTCQKHGLNATEALDILFSGKLPDFCYK